MKKTAVFALLLCLPLSSRAYETENVFVIIMDGLRQDEAFADKSCEFIHPLCEELVPIGSLLTNFKVLTATSSSPAHINILTGYMENTLMEREDTTYPLYPTFFEYFRKATGEPETSALILGNFGGFKEFHRSLHPLYGEAYRGANGVTDVMDRDDDVMALFYEALETVYPRVALVNLHDIDLAGHTGDFGEYTNAIRRASWLIVDLWEYIQANPLYAGRTTLLITTDHGRFSDNFTGHGGVDEGNRASFLLAVGPDIEQGFRSEAPGTLSDIAPTIGELLGFPTPFAEGRVLTEIIHEPEAPTNITWGYRNPSILFDECTVHLAAERMMDGENNFTIIFTTSKDGGRTWGKETVLSSGNPAMEPVIAAGEDRILIFWNEFDWEEGVWQAKEAISFDQGETFQLPSTLADLNSHPKSDTAPPRVIPSDSPLYFFYLYPEGRGQQDLHVLRSDDLGITWNETSSMSLFAEEGFDWASHLSYASFGSSVLLALQANSEVGQKRTVYLFRSDDFGEELILSHNLTPEADWSLLPDIAAAADGSRIVVTWTEYDGISSYRLLRSESQDGGMNFAEGKEVMAGMASAWESASWFDSGVLYTFLTDPVGQKGFLRKEGPEEIVDQTVYDDQAFFGQPSLFFDADQGAWAFSEQTEGPWNATVSSTCPEEVDDGKGCGCSISLSATSFRGGSLLFFLAGLVPVVLRKRSSGY